MSPSFPVRTRQPRRPSARAEAGSSRSPRGEAIVFVVRSILPIVAAVSVIAASDYLAYLIGRKQVTYEELRRQVDRFGQFVQQKRVEDELALTTPKQQRERFEQSGSALTDLTTSTINGKTVVAPEPASARKPMAASLVDDSAVAPPSRVVGSPPPAVHPRTSRKPRGSPTLARRGAAARASAEQSQGTATAIPDTGLAGQ